MDVKLRDMRGPAFTQMGEIKGFSGMKKGSPRGVTLFCGPDGTRTRPGSAGTVTGLFRD